MVLTFVERDLLSACTNHVVADTPVLLVAVNEKTNVSVAEKELPLVQVVPEEGSIPISAKMLQTVVPVDKVCTMLKEEPI